MGHFLVETRNASFLLGGITSLFFVQSGSTIAQIDRLDKRNHLKQVAVEYLENWSFSLYSPFNVS